MITTVLGTCDYCGKENCEVVQVASTAFRGCFACDECREQYPGLRPLEDHTQASDLLSFIALAMFVGAILMVAP